MGMQFNPMYQPVTTTTIKADGDLNVSPYDVEAYDGRFDTVEADEFVGGVGNFNNVIVGVNTSGGLISSTVSSNTVTLTQDTRSGTLTLSANNFSVSSMKTNVSITMKNNTGQPNNTNVTIGGTVYPFSVAANGTATKVVELAIGTYNCSTSQDFLYHTITITAEPKNYYAGISIG